MSVAVLLVGQPAATASDSTAPPAAAHQVDSQTIRFDNGDTFTSSATSRSARAASFTWSASMKCCIYSRTWESRSTGRTSIRLSSFSPGCNSGNGEPQVRFWLEKKSGTAWVRVGSYRDLYCFGETNYWENTGPGTYRFYNRLPNEVLDQRYYNLAGTVTYP